MPNADVPVGDLAEIRRFCEERTPPELADQMRLELDVSGTRVTISDARPPWHPDGTEWTSTVVAQFRFDGATRRWTLHWADRNSRWHPYVEVPATADVGILLAEVADDPTGIFWG